MSGRLWTLASLGAVIALLVALTAPSTGSGGPEAVLVLDRSASIDSSIAASELRWLGHAGGAPVVTYAADPQTVPGSAAEVQRSSPRGVAADDSDPGAALAAAIAAAPASGHVVVVGDGEQTSGDALDAVPAARLKGVHVDAAILRSSAVDAAVTRISAPAVVHQGDTVSLTVTVRSTARVPGQLTVTRDGRDPDSQVIQMRDGETPITLSYTATAAGWHSFDVRVHLKDDQVPQNDALATVVRVGPPPRVLVASTEPSTLAPVLAGRGASVSAVPPSALPASAAGYAGVDAVVLEDVDAGRLSAGQVAALDAAVRSAGLGVTAIGGPASYSLGGYARSGIQRLLPLSSLVPGDLQRRNLALELVIDRSGSMADLSNGVPKIQMAQRAMRQTLGFVAKHRDELGIVDFDIAPHTLVALRRVGPGDRDRIARRIDALRADGGTDIFLGLEQGLEQILRSDSRNRHMILMTDGISQPHSYTRLLRAIARRHISVSTVGLGTDLDVPLLKAIAKATDGNFYQTSDARQLPRIFVKETRLSAKPVQVKGDLTVRPVSSSPVVRSLVSKQLPGLTGNVVTKAKPGAQVDLVATAGSGSADPALAEWQYGTGRVVAWTPGLGPPWAAGWSGQTTLWNDAVRWTASPPAATAPDIQVTTGAQTVLRLDTSALRLLPSAVIPAQLGTGASSLRFDFVASSPGIFTARIPQQTAGVHPLKLTLPPTAGGEQRLLLAVPYPAEFQPPPPGPGVLGEVATQTGGTLLGAADYGSLHGDRRELWPWLVGLALLLFGVSVYGRMLQRRGPVEEHVGASSAAAPANEVHDALPRA